MGQDAGTMVEDRGISRDRGAAAAWIRHWLDPVLFSYSQVFFTRNRGVGLLLLAATFVQPLLGVLGLASILLSFGVVRLAHFSPELARRGMYGYNPLLVGLAVGGFLEVNATVLAVLFLAIIAVIFLQTALESVLGYFFNLPVLSLPFVTVTFVVLAAVPFMKDAHLVSSLTQWSASGASWMPDAAALYLRCLGAIFFQPDLLAGLVVLAALVVYSRIAVVLSFVGFAMGHLLLVQVFDFSSPFIALIVGYNFILTAVALGGVWFVPQRSSFVFAAVGSLIAGLLTAATVLLVRPYRLPVLILPFNLTMFLLLYAMRQRVRDGSPQSVNFAAGSPEENLNTWRTRVARFGSRFLVRFRLPVSGPWTVTQGIDGAHTHKGLWRHAFDFEVLGSDKKNHEGPGTERSQYLSYRLPVVAVADGTVVKVARDVPDNDIGQRNPRDAWGNLVLIQHGLGLYSMVCHLAPDTVKVAEGQFVAKGTVVGLCGNSGRSFVPHVHFQLQATPRVGAPTLESEFHDVVTVGEGAPVLHRNHVPAKGECVRPLVRQEDTAAMFALPIGTRWRFRVTTDGGAPRDEVVVSGIDLYNNLYLESRTTGGRLFFENQNAQFLVYDHHGPRRGVLHLLFASAPRVPFEQPEGLAWDDVLPRRRFLPAVLGWLLDWVDPFLADGGLVLAFSARRDGGDLEVRGTGRLGRRPMATRARFDAGSGPRELELDIGDRRHRAVLLSVETEGQA